LLESFDELILFDVAVTFDVCGSECKLQLNSLVRESHGSDVVQDFSWSAQAGLSVELNLFFVHFLDQSDLDDASVEWVKLIQD
jgi:hypothetical protein